MKQITLLAIMIVISIVGFAQMLGNLTIEGKIINPQSQWVTLSVLGGGQMVTIDSSKVSDNNSFFISTNIDETNFYQLSNGTEQYSILILEPNEQIKININGKQMLQPTEINGSVQTQQLYTLLMEINKFDTKQKKLEADYQALENSADPDKEVKTKALIENFQSIKDNKNAFIKNQINSNPSLATLLFLEQLPIDENLDLYIKVDKALYPKYKTNDFVINIHQKLESKIRLSIGNPAPEISLQSPDGDLIKLSSLKGKVVLIDFWASWCSPCRRDNPHNVELYKKYKDMGFEIYAVSLDKTKSNWVRAIKDDNLSWIHVSDLRYWQSKAAKTYGVASIPFTVLLDKEGNVIATKLRGEALDQKLKEIFGK